MHNAVIAKSALSVAGLALAVQFPSAAGAAPTYRPTGAAALRTLPAQHAARNRHGRRHAAAQSPFQHVIVIVQENRTVDNLFQFFPGANTLANEEGTIAPYATIDGTNYPLAAQNINVPFDPGHSHGSFVKEFDNGQSDGWAADGYSCPAKNPGLDCKNYGANDIAYVNQSSVQPYYDIGNQFILADEAFQANEGPSFPAHQYLIAAQSGGAQAASTWGYSENNAQNGNYSCSNKSKTFVRINMTTPYPGVEGSTTTPCGNYTTIMDELDQAGLSWKYYTHSLTSLWAAPMSISHIYGGADAAKVVSPETSVLTDIANCNLPAVSFVTPAMVNSDHPYGTTAAGPYWPASIVNAIGASGPSSCNYWQNTAVIVTWDDWGGWYDSAPPVPQNVTDPWAGDPYEYGYRTPMLIVSAYDTPQTQNSQFPHVDHTVRTNMSILHFIEDLYGISQLTALDATSDDLFGDFCFTCQPNGFTPINMNGYTFAGKYFRDPRPDIDG